MVPSNKDKRQIASAASLAAIVLLVLGRGGKWVLADHFSRAILFFALLLILRRRSLGQVFRHPACVGTLGFGVWYTLAGILSPSPVAAWSGISGVWCGITLVVLGLTAWREFDRMFLEFLFAGVVCVQAMIDVFGLGPFQFFPGNPQYISFWSCAVVFLAMGKAFPRENKILFSDPVRWGWAAVGLVATVEVLILPVRSGFLALLVGLVIFGSVRFGWRGLAGVGFIAVLCFTFFSSQLVHRLKFEDPHSYKRADIWRSALAGVVDRPLFGWGPGQFENLYWRHGLPQNEDPVRFEMTTDRAHNDLLQYFAESGIPGGLFALWALFGLWVSDPKGSRGVGLRAVWGSLGTFAMVNSPLILPACGALVGCVAVLSPPGRSLRRIPISSRSRRWLVPLVGSMAVLLGVGELALALNEERGPHRFIFLDSFNLRRVETLRDGADQRLHSGLKGDDILAEKELRELLRWNPQRADLWRDLGHLEAHHRDFSRINEALNAYRSALSLAPNKAPWRVEMAQIMVKGGDLPSARRLLAEAIRIEPHYFDAGLGFGILLRQEGRPENAKKWLETLRRQSQFWPTANPGDSGYRKTVLRRDLAPLDETIELCKKDLES